MLSVVYSSRIKVEQAIMAKELPQFKLFNFGSKRYFTGWHTTTTGRHRYQLRLVLPKWYPDQMPKLYVTSPRILRKYGRGTINSMVGVSHAFHIQEKGADGCVQICHFMSASWDASKTCVGIFFKGILWLEAYEVHLSTGMDIAEILDQWKRR